MENRVDWNRWEERKLNVVWWTEERKKKQLEARNEKKEEEELFKTFWKKQNIEKTKPNKKQR